MNEKQEQIAEKKEETIYEYFKKIYDILGFEGEWIKVDDGLDFVVVEFTLEGEELQGKFTVKSKEAALSLLIMLKSLEKVHLIQSNEKEPGLNLKIYDDAMQTLTKMITKYNKNIKADETNLFMLNHCINFIIQIIQGKTDNKTLDLFKN